ncbi:MAG: lactoylglutathione lyase [Motiliproteus sp.]|jgi:lactoylglutathione lyase
MDTARHGIILNVERFDACVDFYRNVFNLPFIFEKAEGSFRLCCLEYGDCYLMIETEGIANSGGKPISECPTKFRFNVPDLNSALLQLNKFGIDAEIVTAGWGSIINIFDPDGNRISIRDELGFCQQTST